MKMTYIIMLLFGCYSVAILAKKPVQVGLLNDQLMPCNDRSNCVITQEVEGQRPNVQPILYKGTREEAFEGLKTLINEIPRTTILVESYCYLHVIVKSRVWRFIDDVEFYLPSDEKIIHIRSAARTGKYDFGVNKNRVELIRKRCNALGL